MQDVAISSQTSSRNFVLIAGLLLYCGGFAILLAIQVSSPLTLSLCSWSSESCCRSLRGLRLAAVPLSISVRSGVPELIVLIAYVVAVSVYLIGGPQWIDQHLPAGWTNSQQIKFVITLAKKLFVFVAIPFAIFRFCFGYRLRDFGIQRQGLRALCAGHCSSFSRWAERSLLFNISSAAAALRFGVNTLLLFNCWSVCRFASCGSCWKRG